MDVFTSTAKIAVQIEWKDGEFDRLGFSNEKVAYTYLTNARRNPQVKFAQIEKVEKKG